MSCKIKYNGVQIAEMTSDGSKTLKTSGKYVPHDLSVEYAGGGGGGVTIPEHGVLFIDYDGEVVAAWDSADVASQNALPSNPSHSGLTSQGWNYTLAQIKAYIAANGSRRLYVGQLYAPTSGKTEFDIALTATTGKEVVCNMSGMKDWGDGTSDSDTSHIYADYGDYTIKCGGSAIPTGTSSAGGLFNSTSTDANGNWCTAIRFGANITSLPNYAFIYCRSVKTITMPSSITSIGTYCFANCQALVSMTLPSIPTVGTSMFNTCRVLRRISIADGVTTLGTSVFSSAFSIEYVSLPDSVTSIGSNSFQNCYALPEFAPKSIASISGNAFNGSSNILVYDFSRVTAVPSLANTNVFSGINFGCVIKVPSALYNSWKSAANWSSYADYIVAV